MSILPTGRVKDEPGYFGPDYDFAGEVPLPGNIGVRRGDSISSVIAAARGAAYYTDVIGFGQKSSDLSPNFPIAPLGVNYFIRTGLQCDNGADMWYYVEGIPTGTALGKRVQDGLRSSGLPQLRGLAPGILEDAKDALNPMPVINAMLGSGYPKCEKVTLPVGDAFKRIGNGVDPPWITGPVTYSSQGWPQQTKWIQETVKRGKDTGKPIYITKDEWDKTPKLFCGDGSAVKDHVGEDCSKPLKKKEGFSSRDLSPTLEGVVVTTGFVLAAICAVGLVSKRR